MVMHRSIWKFCLLLTMSLHYLNAFLPFLVILIKQKLFSIKCISVGCVRVAFAQQTFTKDVHLLNHHISKLLSPILFPK